MGHMEGCADGVQVVSRRMVRPSLPPVAADAEEIHLTPWDLRMLTIGHIQRGILLPQPPVGGADLAEALASSLARALGRVYVFAGRLAAQERSDGTVTVSLRCTGEGAEFVHATAPGVAMADITASLYTPPVVSSFFPLNQVLGMEAAIDGLPVLSVQVTELGDGVFVGMSMNHSVGDGTNFWEFFNTWSAISRGGIMENLSGIATPLAPAVFRRWFLETSPVPIPLPFSKLQHLVPVVRRRSDRPTLQVCFFTFSATRVKKLKARANEEMAGRATATISSLQALLAHLWRAVCRARRLVPETNTSYQVVVGCRGRMDGIPPGYVGNAMLRTGAESTAGEIEKNGLGWAAWLLNRAVASFDEARMRGILERWVQEPEFPSMQSVSSSGAVLLTGSSPRFDMFGNDFGWGKPVAVRSDASGNKPMDGSATVFEGPEKGGSMSLEVCLTPDAIARLVADEEFMDAVSSPSPASGTSCSRVL